MEGSVLAAISLTLENVFIKNPVVKIHIVAIIKSQCLRANTKPTTNLWVLWYLDLEKHPLTPQEIAFYQECQNDQKNVLYSLI